MNNSTLLHFRGFHFKITLEKKRARKISQMFRRNECKQGQTSVSIYGVPANITSRNWRKEIRNVTTAANLLCPNTATAHNIKYRHAEDYYYRALLERQTGKQRNDEHSALYHPS